MLSDGVVWSKKQHVWAALGSSRLRDHRKSQVSSSREVRRFVSKTSYVHDVGKSSEDVREEGAKDAGSPANAKGRTCWRSTAHQI